MRKEHGCGARDVAIWRWGLRLLLCASAAALAACGHNPAAPDGPTIGFNFSAPEVVIGDTLQLTATVREATGNPIPNVTLTWTSLNPNIATVSSDGLVTAINMGETEIEVEATIPDAAQTLATPTWQDRALALLVTPLHAAGSRKVKSKAKIYSVPKVVVSPRAPTIPVKGTQSFTALITNSKDFPLSAQPKITWSSSNKAVATIDVAGFATGVANGSTTITATVTVGSAHAVPATATLTVSDQCDGIASVSTLRGGLDYLYERSGKSGTTKIHSKFNASLLTATLTKDFANSEAGVAQWRGPLKGTASQAETMTYEGGGQDTLNSTGGAFSHSEMVVIVNLAKCTYRIVATLVYPVTRTDTTNNIDQGVDIVQGDGPLYKRTDPGSYFGNIPPFMPYPAGTDPFVPGNIFVVSGFAQKMDDLGNAEVSFTLTASDAMPIALVDQRSHFVRDTTVGDVRFAGHHDLLGVPERRVVPNGNRFDVFVLVKFRDAIEEIVHGKPAG